MGVKKKSSVAINETKHANASPKSCSRAKAWTKRAVGVCGGGYFCHRNADIAPNKCTTFIFVASYYFNLIKSVNDNFFQILFYYWYFNLPGLFRLIF